MVVVPVILSNQEILNNEGENQLMDVLDSYMDAGERALEDAMDVGIHSDGSANSGKQLTGLKVAIPTTANAGIYGGINRRRRQRVVADQDVRRPHRVPDHRHAGQLHHHPADPQRDPDPAIAGQGLRRSAADVAGALRGV